jgi:alpha-galactosidase
LLAPALPALRAAGPSSGLAGQIWSPGTFPFSFRYDGKDSAGLLGAWRQSGEDSPASDGQRHRYIYLDPATHLKVVAELVTYSDFDAADWVLEFSNQGSADTPIISEIEPLHWTMSVDSAQPVLHAVRGSNAKVEDFTPIDTTLTPGRSVLLGTGSGRSSDDSHAPQGNRGSFPYFNLQTGDHGLLGAIGWTGSWRAHFTLNADGTAVALDAGMAKTHLKLHPGETIRTPRIVLLPWHGDRAASQNLWRQFMLTHYSPRNPAGQLEAMPIAWDTWGTERAAVKLAVIAQIKAQKISADLYWIDAGWYEPIALPRRINSLLNSEWPNHRGDWIASHDLYPQGMRPLGEALKSAGIGFSLWFEAETANPDSNRLKEHPDWYFQPQGKRISFSTEFMLNLGNPAAFRSITDQVSDFITEAELTWYRQDFTFQPASYWSSADAPDRIGMNEIKSITGLYAYWDELVARHPGLRLDNGASGGRRLDIEMARRSVALWRSDHAGEPVGEQYHTLALMPWVPLASGVWFALKSSAPKLHTEKELAKELYEQRSGYGPGLTVCIDQDPAPWIKAAFEEFAEVRPYFTGNFYPLTPLSSAKSGFAAWQLQQLDRRSGVVIALRRPGKFSSILALNLEALDPQAHYDVEVRLDAAPSPHQTISGADLAHWHIQIKDDPGSALVFYRRQ